MTRFLAHCAIALAIGMQIGVNLKLWHNTHLLQLRIETLEADVAQLSHKNKTMSADYFDRLADAKGEGWDDDTARKFVISSRKLSGIPVESDEEAFLRATEILFTREEDDSE